MFIFWAHLFFCTYYDLLERCVQNVVFYYHCLCALSCSYERKMLKGGGREREVVCGQVW